MYKKAVIVCGFICLLTACGADGTDDSGDPPAENGGNEAEENASVAEPMRLEESSTDGGVESGSAYDEAVVDFELEISFSDDREWEFEYEDANGSKEAEIEKDGQPDTEGDEAIAEIEELLQQIQITGEQTDEEMANEIISALGVNEQELYKLELSIEYANGNMYRVQLPYGNVDTNDSA